MNIKKNTITNQELIEYMLGSLELIQDYLNGYTEDQFFSSMLVQDAVCNRIFEVGHAASLITDDLLNKYPKFPWRIYTSFKIFNSPDTVWTLAGGKNTLDDKFESINSYFNELELLYLNEFFSSKLKIPTKNIDIPQTRIYKYPIVTSKSIWTVRKK